jgi:hypothetical protein
VEGPTGFQAVGFTTPSHYTTSSSLLTLQAFKGDTSTYQANIVVEAPHLATLDGLALQELC